MNRLTPQQLAEIRERITSLRDDYENHWAECRNRGVEGEPLPQYHDDLENFSDHITALEADSAALVKHTTHLDGCHITYTNDGPKMCSCGLAELLKQEPES